jgi:hypothetical protein
LLAVDTMQTANRGLPGASLGCANGFLISQSLDRNLGCLISKHLIFGLVRVQGTQNSLIVE